MKFSRLFIVSICFLFIVALCTIMSLLIGGHAALPSERVAEARMIPRNPLIGATPLPPNHPPVAYPDSYTVHGTLVLDLLATDCDRRARQDYDSQLRFKWANDTAQRRAESRDQLRL